MQAGTSHGSIRINGKKRTFRLHIPRGLRQDRPSGTEESTEPKLVPLIIVLHGALGSGWSAEWDSRMSQLSEKYKFIAAYPNGAARTWNAGSCCGPARRWNVDDVRFIHEMIVRLKKELPIDPNRVFVTGISNGGMMAYTLGEQLPDDIAAIAPVQGCMFPKSPEANFTMSDAKIAGTINGGTVSQRNGFGGTESGGAAAKAPVSVVAIHGNKDRIIRYEGGTGSMFGYKVNSQSVADTMQYWVRRDQCTSIPQHEESDIVIKDLYRDGVNGTEVCLYTVKDAGHAWPGGRRCVFAGDKPSKGFSASEAMYAFFMSHPKIH